MKKIIYLFYNYYNSGHTKDVAYGNSLFAIVTLISFNIATFVVLMTGEVEVSAMPKSRGWQFFTFAVYLAMCSLILSLIFPKKKIVEYIYKGNIKVHSWVLFAYYVLSMLLFSYVVANRDRFV
jgi:ABC-type uncharacterized transport system permease subunit